MAAPKGNKYGKFNPLSGRPKTYTKEFIDKEALALAEWSESDEAYILREFSAIRGYVPNTLYEFVQQNEAFRSAYEYAKNIIGARREQQLLDRQSDKPYLKYANWHDEEIHKFERAEARFENDLKVEQIASYNPNDEAKIENMMNVIDRASKKKLKVE